MQDPLPRRYRIVLWVVGLVSFVGAGAWVAFSTPLPLLWQYGAVVGALAALAAVPAFVRHLGRGSGATPSRG